MSRIFFKNDGSNVSPMATLALIAGFLAVVAFVAAGPLYTEGVYGSGDNNAADLGLRIRLVLGAAAAAALGAVFVVLAMLHTTFSARRRGSWRTLVGALMSAAILAPVAIMAMAGRDAPQIHDVTTDLAAPPRFLLTEPRLYSPNSRTGYAGGMLADDYADLHRSGYGDLRALEVPFGVASVTTLAGAVAIDLGWTVSDTSPQAGRIEAYDVTGWFGFRDNIVIRVTATADGSKVDIRSQSVVGISDLGANAARIRAFIQAMVDRSNELAES